MRNVFAIVLAGALLAACGQRGALYLPGEPREQVGATTTGAAPTATPAVPQASPIPPAATTTAPESDPESEARRRNRAN